MTSHSVVLTIEGPEANNHHLELSVFAEKIRQFGRVLTNSIEGERREEVVINVVRLSHSSPAVVECQPMLDKAPHIPTLGNLEANLGYVVSGDTDRVGDGLLSALEKLAERNPEKIAGTRLTTVKDETDGGRAFELDDAFCARLASARREEYTEASTIDGVLEEINIHSKPYTCKIYDASFASATIRCEFPDELLEQIQHALGSGVFVSGDFFYRPKTSIPYKIRVQEIELLPPSEQVPSLSDLKGIAPGLTGNKQAEEFVREQRDQWDKD